jgi:hypothetical protein
MRKMSWKKGGPFGESESKLQNICCGFSDEDKISNAKANLRKTLKILRDIRKNDIKIRKNVNKESKNTPKKNPQDVETLDPTQLPLNSHMFVWAVVVRSSLCCS